MFISGSISGYGTSKGIFSKYLNIHRRLYLLVSVFYYVWYVKSYVWYETISLKTLKKHQKVLEKVTNQETIKKSEKTIKQFTFCKKVIKTHCYRYERPSTKSNLVIDMKRALGWIIGLYLRKFRAQRSYLRRFSGDTPTPPPPPGGGGSMI